MMKRYSSYKPSNVEWILEIPSHWDSKKLKFSCDLVSENINVESFQDKEVVHYSIPNVQEFGTGKLELGEDIDSSKVRLYGGEVLLSKLNPRKSSVTIVENSEHLIVGSGEFLTFKPKEVSPRLLFYQFKNQSFTDYLNSCVESVTRSHQRVSPEIVYTSRCVIPPTHEQLQIVQFLDTKTSLIDSLIEKTEKKIEILKEQKTSLINHVVTKGLNPNVKMKDSGVEWIGDIPNGWEISRMDFLFNLFGRLGWKSLKSEEYVDDGYIFLSTPNIKNKEIDFENVNYITEERYLESPEIMLEVGDVLLVKDGSTLGIVNIVKYLPSPSTVNSSIGVLKRISDKIISEFLYYFLATHYSQSIIDRIKGGMGVPHLFQSDIKKFIVILPPISEQREIVDYLDERTKLIDSTISIEERRVELLKEYRQSLISEVVTGKIKVTTDE